VLVVGQGLHRLCVGWGWSAAAISTLLRGAPFLTSFNAGGCICVCMRELQGTAFQSHAASSDRLHKVLDCV
jgi:hypothetical protein